MRLPRDFEALEPDVGAGQVDHHVLLEAARPVVPAGADAGDRRRADGQAGLAEGELEPLEAHQHARLVAADFRVAVGAGREGTVAGERHDGDAGGLGPVDVAHRAGAGLALVDGHRLDRRRSAAAPRRRRRHRGGAVAGGVAAAVTGRPGSDASRRASSSVSSAGGRNTRGNGISGAVCAASVAPTVSASVVLGAPRRIAAAAARRRSRDGRGRGRAPRSRGAPIR